jgi:hypothetical protein
MNVLAFPVGIEIETTIGRVPRNATPASWIHKTDASCGLEFASPKIETQDELNEVNSICEKLGQHVRANAACGLHVHVGVNQIKDLSAKYRIFRFMSKYESLFFDLMPPNSIRAHYCQKLTNKEWKALGHGNGFEPFKAPTQPIDYFHGPERVKEEERRANELIAERRKWFNGQAYHKHGTVEFRLMNGTLDPKEILGWTHLLLAIFSGVVNDNVKVDWNAPKAQITVQHFLEDARVIHQLDYRDRAIDFVTRHSPSQYDLKRCHSS